MAVVFMCNVFGPNMKLLCSNDPKKQGFEFKFHILKDLHKRWRFFFGYVIKARILKKFLTLFEYELFKYKVGLGWIVNYPNDKYVLMYLICT